MSIFHLTLVSWQVFLSGETGPAAAIHAAEIFTFASLRTCLTASSNLKSFWLSKRYLTCKVTFLPLTEQRPMFVFVPPTSAASTTDFGGLEKTSFCMLNTPAPGFEPGYPCGNGISNLTLPKDIFWHPRSTRLCHAGKCAGTPLTRHNPLLRHLPVQSI